MTKSRAQLLATRFWSASLNLSYGSCFILKKGNGVTTSHDVDERLKKVIPEYNKHCGNLSISIVDIKKAIENAKLKIQNEAATTTEVYILIEHLMKLAGAIP